MSYRFNVRTTNYEWASVFNNFYRNELNQYSQKHLEMKLKFQNLLIKSKEAFEFANKLFTTVTNNSTELYEEVDVKISNCQFFMENKFDGKAQQLLSGIQFSEDTYERYVEILSTYTDVIIRGYEEIMQDELNQIGRIVTSINGLLDDLQFTLELNGMFERKINKEKSPELLIVNYLPEDIIRRELAEVTSLEKSLKEVICA